MRIGVPKERKPREYRVAITPSGVDALVADGHTVLVEADAGVGSGFSNEAFAAAGATILEQTADVWAGAELVTKVKEPIADEYAYLRDDLVLFAYLHLAVEPDLTARLQTAGATAVAFEAVERADGIRPLLVPMSEVAGRLSVIVGSYHLQTLHGGAGQLMGGIAGAPRAQVVVIGGGVAGEHAAANALGLGAQVTVIDIDLPRLGVLEARYGGALQTRPSTRYAIGDAIRSADLVIGSVLIPGAAAPKLVTDEMIRSMKPGAVLVDIAIDQGGCFEHAVPRTHDDPTYAVHDTLFYSVANMPGAVPATSTVALTNATLPYLRRIAANGWADASRDPGLVAGLYVAGGEIRNAAVAEALRA